MNIVVCIKQVPETTKIKIDPETNTLMREGADNTINPFDMYALEEGLRLKEKWGGKVTVITMGPPQAKEALGETISCGAEEVVLLSDRHFAGSDTLATSYVLAEGIKKIAEFDLIICGKQAIDGDTAQVGPEIAERLQIPCITFVRKIDQVTAKTIRAERMMDDGCQIIEMELPGLISVVKEINEPRMPSLKGKMRAKKADIPVWGMNDLEIRKESIGLNGSPTRVIKIFTPPKKGRGEILEGSAEEKVALLIDKLKELKAINLPS